jgi:cellulose synthase/poly-beta-1,6-N-acetylglucosamine synthase-like glycosyltransferase
MDFNISILFLLFVYFLRTIFFKIGFQKQIKTITIGNSDNELPFVSIIVPARNEEKNIQNSIVSILNSTYPKDRYEIIAINDRSDDKTKSILEELSKKNLNLRIINVNKENRINNLRGKPGALQQGYNVAKGDLILMTDADCIVNQSWIETVVNNFSPKKVGMVASFTLIDGHNFFDKIQAIEWIFLHTMASGALALGHPLGCYGNNLSVKKDDYFKVGGYRNIRFSVTEDLALEQAFFREGIGIKYLCSFESSVTTLPTQTLKEYLKQRKRWAIGGRALGWRAFLFVLSSLAIWIAILISALNLNFSSFYIVIIFKILCDFALIAKPLKILKRESLYIYLVPAILIFILMELIVPFLIIDKRVSWKGQTF